jgi:hypothetical protein
MHAVWTCSNMDRCHAFRDDLRKGVVGQGDKLLLPAMDMLADPDVYPFIPAEMLYLSIYLLFIYLYRTQTYNMMESCMQKSLYLGWGKRGGNKL